MLLNGHLSRGVHLCIRLSERLDHFKVCLRDMSYYSDDITLVVLFRTLCKFQNLYI